MTITYSATLSDGALAVLAEHCPRLWQLRIEEVGPALGVAGLVALATGAPALRRLSVVDCEGVGPAEVDAFMECMPRPPPPLDAPPTWDELAAGAGCLLVCGGCSMRACRRHWRGETAQSAKRRRAFAFEKGIAIVQHIPSPDDDDDRDYLGEEADQVGEEEVEEEEEEEEEPAVEEWKEGEDEH